MFSLRIKTVALLGFMGMVLGCSAGTLKGYTPHTTTESQVQATLIELEQSWKRGDTEAVLALFDEDAQIMIGTDRQVLSKVQFAAALPARMAAMPSFTMGPPVFGVSADDRNAIVKTIMNVATKQYFYTFSLAMENERWWIKKSFFTFAD